MKRTSFTDEQIIGMLAGLEAGAKCAGLRRKHGMPEGTFCNWRAKFGGTTEAAGRADARSCPDEGTGFRNVVAPVVKHEAAAHLKVRFRLPEWRACRIAGADRTLARYQSQRAPGTERRGRFR